MTPEVIAAYIALGISILGFAIFLGKFFQKQEESIQDISDIKEEMAKNKEEHFNLLDKQTKEYTNNLKEHIDSSALTEHKLECVKTDLQKYVRETIKQEERLRQNKEQTEELKKEFGMIKIEVNGIKDTTFEIKNDVGRLQAVLEQLVTVSTKTQDTVQKILENNMTRRADDMNK